MPQQLGQGNCQYTVVSTVGTSTLNPGQASGPPISPGVFFGATMQAVGTSFGITALDIAGTSTQTLMSGTGTAVGQRLVAGLEGVGVRYRDALVVVTTGTAGAYNALWD